MPPPRESVPPWSTPSFIMKLTYFGHSCFQIEYAGKNLLFDPFITPNELAKNVSLSSITADYILISHGHYDHIFDAVALAKQTGAKVVANFEVTEWLRKQGIEDVHPMNPGGAWSFDFGRVKFVNAIHSSSFPDGSYAGNAGGFVISGPEGDFYYAGDTGLTIDMQLIAESYALKFAVLPIGDNVTMGYPDAIRAAQLLQCDRVVGVHYDTFPFIRIDKHAAYGSFIAAGKSLLLPAIGETIDV